MFLKGTLAAGLMAATLAVLPAPAEAKTSVHIGIGIGTPYYCGPYVPSWRCRYYGYYDPYYYPYHRRPYVVHRVSCGEARDILRHRGYTRIRAHDCSGSHYVFTAAKRGHLYRVKVSARNGAVISVTRV